MSHAGGCQCGAVRYRAGSIEDFSLCHCRMCQKAFGNFGAALVIARDVTFTRGAPAEFRSSAIVARGFCPACGTQLYMREDGAPHEIAVGTLDRPQDAGPPLWQSGIESRLAWVDDIGALPAETTADSRTAADLLRLKSRQHPDHDTDAWPEATS